MIYDMHYDQNQKNYKMTLLMDKNWLRFKALAAEMNISETCFLTLLPEATKGCDSHLITFAVNHTVIRLQGGVSLWVEVVYANQWSKYNYLFTQNIKYIKKWMSLLQKMCLWQALKNAQL